MVRQKFLRLCYNLVAGYATSKHMNSACFYRDEEIVLLEIDPVD
jgi:hypothetical protein